MSYDPRSQNYDAMRANTGVSRRNANEFVYDPYPQAQLWKIIRRCIWAVFLIGAFLTVSFVYFDNREVDDEDVSVPAPAVVVAPPIAPPVTVRWWVPHD